MDAHEGDRQPGGDRIAETDVQAEPQMMGKVKRPARPVMGKEGAETCARRPRERRVARHRAARRLGAEEQRERDRSEEHTSELQSLMRISYAVFCLKKKKKTKE